MLESEESTLWDKFMGPVTKALDYAFGCHHEHLSRVFTIKGRSYQVCCDCGKDFDYSLRTMSIIHRRTLAPRLRLLRMRHI